MLKRQRGRYGRVVIFDNRDVNGDFDVGIINN